MSFMKRSIGIA